MTGDSGLVNVERLRVVSCECWLNLCRESSTFYSSGSDIGKYVQEECE